MFYRVLNTLLKIVIPYYHDCRKREVFDENLFIDVEQIRKQLQKELHEKAIF